MDFLNNPSDDQIAAIGCALAFIVSGGLMYVSVFVGRLGQKSEKPERTDTVHFESAIKKSESQADTDRKVA